MTKPKVVRQWWINVTPGFQHIAYSYRGEAELVVADGYNTTHVVAVSDLKPLFAALEKSIEADSGRAHYYEFEKLRDDALLQFKELMGDE